MLRKIKSAGSKSTQGVNNENQKHATIKKQRSCTGFQNDSMSSAASASKKPSIFRRVRNKLSKVFTPQSSPKKSASRACTFKNPFDIEESVSKIQQANQNEQSFENDLQEGQLEKTKNSSNSNELVSKDKSLSEEKVKKIEGKSLYESMLELSISKSVHPPQLPSPSRFSFSIDESRVDRSISIDDISIDVDDQ